MSARLKSVLGTTAIIIVAVLIGGLIGGFQKAKILFWIIFLLIIFVIIPCIIDYIRTYKFAKRAKDIQRWFLNNQEGFISFINNYQPFWDIDSRQNSNRSLQITESIFLNYHGPRDLFGAVTGLWEDWKMVN